MDEKAPGPEENEELDEVPVSIRESDHYQILPATGSRGGIQPQGNFKIDFVFDYTKDPETELYEVTEGGLGEFVDTVGDVGVIREKQVGISLSQRDALSVGAWTLASILGPPVQEEDIIELLIEEYPDKIGRDEA